MKKIIIFIVMLSNILITTNIIKGVKANSEDVSKPLVLLVGGEYDNYFNVDGYEIINNNVNTNKCGNYSITYMNTSTNKTYEKKVYVKSEEELLSDNCYAEKYQTIYSSNNRISTSEVEKAGDYTYIALKEEIREDIYNLRFIKQKNSITMFNKLVMVGVNGYISDFILADEEIVLLINKVENDNQDVYIKTISYDGNDIYEKHLEGNNFDKGIKVLEEREHYNFIIETSSNSGSIYNNLATTSYITVYTMVKNDKEDTYVDYYRNNYDISIVDAYQSRFGLLVVSKYYDTSIKLTYHILSVFDVDGTYINTNSLSANLGEEYSKMKEADNGEIYYMVSKYNNELRTNEYSLYMLNQNLVKSHVNTYHYEKSPNAILSDFIVYDKENIVVLYSLVDLTKKEPYGYMYQILNKDKVELEIENYSSTMLCDGFLDNDTLLFTNSEDVIINDIEYLRFSMLNNDVTTSTNTLSIYPVLYINGEKIKLDTNKSIMNFDVNVHGSYNVVFYFSHNKMDVALYGFVNVEPYVNVKHNETYDNNLKLTFTGTGVLNDYKIESGYVITTPGTYLLEIIGVNDSSYEVFFTVEKISSNNEILNENEIKLNIKEEKILSTSNININNNIKENDLKNTNNYTWTYIIPVCASIILIFSILKKRG